MTPLLAVILFAAVLVHMTRPHSVAVAEHGQAVILLVILILIVLVVFGGAAAFANANGANPGGWLQPG